MFDDTGGARASVERGGLVALAAGRRSLVTLQQRAAEKVFNARLSRREFMKLAAGASVSGALWGPLARAAARFELETGGNEVCVRAGGAPLFHLSTDHFDGTPRITVRRGKNAFAIRLNHALFPGTNASADLVLAGHREGVGWQARLRLPSLDFDASFPFEQWLLGYPVARSAVRFPFELSRASRWAITVDHKATATLLPGRAPVAGSLWHAKSRTISSLRRDVCPDCRPENDIGGGVIGVKSPMEAISMEGIAERSAV